MRKGVTLLVTPLTLSLEQNSRIADAESFHQLSMLRRELLQTSTLKNATSAGELAPLVVMINLIHDQIVKQAIKLSVDMLRRIGMGIPPVPYAFLQFGSGGRQEQAILSDQDNGLVYVVPDFISQRECDQIADYFRLMVAAIVQGLAEVGYPPCHGNVICSNRRWHGPLFAWEEMFKGWTEKPTWENMRFLLLTSDARMISGNAELYHNWHSLFFRNLASNPQLAPRLANNILHHHIPLGLFNRVLTEIQGKHRGGLNIKYGVYLPIVNCVRLYALINGIESSSTVERIAALREKQIWPNSFCNSVENHFRKITGLRLLSVLQWQDDDYLSNSFIKPAELSKEMIGSLKSSMKLALQLQTMVRRLLSQERGLSL